MKRYAIWEHITEEGREAALHEQYTQPCSTDDGDTEDTRTPDGHCPLGLALRAMGVDVGPAPYAHEVATALVGGVGADSDVAAQQLVAPADEFAEDWDRGRIGADRLREAI
jgi:hypothetical protein